MQAHVSVGEMAEMKCELRVKEVAKFEESKMGVKGLMESGLTNIPHIFIHPPESLSHLKPASSSNLQLPIVDLSATTERSKIVHQIQDSLSTWGFFQVINHGIPTQVMEETIKAFKSFHEQGNKSGYVWDQKVSYNSDLNMYMSKALTWKDTFRVHTSPNPPQPETIPSVCRKELMEWDECMRALCETLMEFICEDLGVSSNRLSCSETRKFTCHYYPYCPQSDLTLGLAAHTDRSVLTLLLQNEVNALQVKYGEEWVEVKPVPGAIIVNAGDLLQIFSNDKYQSVPHRAVANSSKEPRVTLSVFFYPDKTGEADWYGPLPEMLSTENPARYRNFTIPEMKKLGPTAKSFIKALVDLFKLNG